MLRRTFKSYRKQTRLKFRNNIKKCITQIKDQEIIQYFAREMQYNLYNFNRHFVYPEHYHETLEKKYSVFK